MKRQFFAFLFLLVAVSGTHATHLRAGEITIERQSCSALIYTITVTVYIDTKEGVLFGGDDDWLDFGDGERMLIPVTRTTPRPELGEEMGVASFTTTHIYRAIGTYIVSYSEPNRNRDVLNMDFSVNTRFYLETAIFLDASIACNRHLPQLSIPPIDKACHGVSFFHSAGAYDIDGDSLSYEIGIPQQRKQTPVVNYKDPNDPKFYTNYSSGNETKDGPPSFSIDPFFGILQWNAPGALGEYNVAFRIVEWRKNKFTGVWQRLSYVTRDMQIIVQACENKRPELIMPQDTCVVAGTVLDANIFGTDPENHPVKIEIFSEILSQPSSPVIIPATPVFLPSSPARMHFSWSTQCSHIKEQYYQVVFKITDNPPQGPKLVTFRSWRIKVVGPAPLWRNIIPDPVRKIATLTWRSYACSNASHMEIWRRIDETFYTPGVCETGMPALGYTRVATVALKDSLSGNDVTQYVDTNNGRGLQLATKYCYRMVAIFPDPRGGESYVSNDICLDPFPAEAPVITHVTVEKTDQQEGIIHVSWRSPFDLDKTQFPGPFEYALLRTITNDETAWTAITPTPIQDTTFIDVGLNTQSEVYRYQVVLFANSVAAPHEWVPLDTSYSASSVKLATKSQKDAVSLQWAADVPWSNQSPKYPYHRIYRAEQGIPETMMTLIDSADITQSPVFTYVDRGTYNNTPLEVNKVYCYKIMTRGVYGNPEIDEPLQNFSQMICVRVGDTTAPCQPMLSIRATDCEALFASGECNINDFKNTLSWSFGKGASCAEDIASYTIYSAVSTNNEFTILASGIKDTVYEHTNLTSFARCYKIVAVDASGNESGFSNIVCNDNCPYFELPNIFTPNDDGCNDFFSAYGPFNPLRQNASPCQENEDYARCVRFVEEVDFRVYNRWGERVYTYVSWQQEDSVYINWNGKDQGGTQLASGVYYYVADVIFNTVDPTKKSQTFKGWVHLVR